jgi:hypothetical protein
MRNPWKDKGLIMGLKDIAKSGVLGVGSALVADNPKLLKGFGVAGNAIYNQIENRADDKRIAAEQAAADKKTADMKEKKAAAEKAKYISAARVPSAGMEGGYKGYAKGGKVSSASKRADGCAIKGKTKGRMV